jgi:hypothetical protein
MCFDHGWCLGLNSGVVDDPSFGGGFLRDRLLNLLDYLGFLDPADGRVFEEDDDHN